jgi:hypothetical protein
MDKFFFPQRNPSAVQWRQMDHQVSKGIGETGGENAAQDKKALRRGKE